MEAELDRLRDIIWILWGCLALTALIALTPEERKPYCVQHRKPADQCKDEHR
jgi:hypothetical protein